MTFKFQNWIEKIKAEITQIRKFQCVISTGFIMFRHYGFYNSYRGHFLDIPIKCIIDWHNAGE